MVTNALYHTGLGAPEDIHHAGVPGTFLSRETLLCSPEDPNRIGVRFAESLSLFRPVLSFYYHLAGAIHDEQSST
jgi:hypothetical protein